MKLIKIAGAALNQTPLDWENNQKNILSAIALAKAEQVGLLCLPELSISGYGCEDAFLSAGALRTSLEVLLDIVPHTTGIAVAVGLPVSVEDVVYDAAAVIVDGKLRGFVAKQYLAGEGLHYEPRWFSPWPKDQRTELKIGESSYPFGDLTFEWGELRFGFEICEDAWAAKRPGIELFEERVDVILNPSASHFAFGKFETRKRFVIEGSRAFSCAYVYANLLGNEAGRVIYDGGTLIASHGKLLSAGKRFSYRDVLLTAAVIDLDKARLDRGRVSSGKRVQRDGSQRCVSAAGQPPPAVPQGALAPDDTWESGDFVKEEEFSRAVSLGLFDYMRKSRSRGFVVSLSGGADSSCVSCLIALMVHGAFAELGRDELLRKLSYFTEIQALNEPRPVMQHLLSCIYQATENSSDRTRESAQKVAEAIGAFFAAADVQELVSRYVSLGGSILNSELRWDKDDVSLQNVQARVRGPLVWLIANVKNAVLLATSNRSEAAVGYTTMDGDTCGGLSPIAGIDKAFLLHWLRWLERSGPAEFGALPALSYVTSQEPTAELRPKEQKQTDEQDLMPYAVLDVIERLAIRDKRMPDEVLRMLRTQFKEYDDAQLAAWTKRFFILWSRNQWKRERYAPSFHLDDENLDPKTWCRFPILSGGFARELSAIEAEKK